MFVPAAGQTLPAPPAGVLLGSSGNDVLLGGAGNDLVLGGQAGDVLVGGFAHEAPAATSKDVLGSDTPSQERTVSVDGPDSHDLALDAWSLHGSGMGDNGAGEQTAEPVSDWLFLHEQGTGPLDLAFALQGGAGLGDMS
jgi:Ca2+-binding RTX toxin-like protein